MGLFDRNYCTWLKNVSLMSFNETLKSSCDRCILLSLHFIHRLFQKNVLFDDNSSSKRETKCKQLLSNYDDLFLFVMTKGNKKEVCYHIKNAISHGRIDITPNDITFEDNYNKVDFIGTISISDLAAGAIGILEKISDKIPKPIREEYKYGFETSLLNTDNRISFKTITATLSFLMSHENNYKKISSLCEHNTQLISLIDSIFMFDLNGKPIGARDVRNALSHHYSIKEGCLLLDEKHKLDFFDWLYINDGMGYVGDIILFLLLLENSPPSTTDSS